MTPLPLDWAARKDIANDAQLIRLLAAQMVKDDIAAHFGAILEAAAKRIEAVLREGGS